MQAPDHTYRKAKYQDIGQEVHDPTSNRETTYTDTLCPWDTSVPEGGYGSALKDCDQSDTEPLTKDGNAGNIDG